MGGAVLPKGLVHNMLVLVLVPQQLKSKISKIEFFDVVAIYIHPISHVKYGMARYNLLQPLDCETYHLTVC